MEEHINKNYSEDLYNHPSILTSKIPIKTYHSEGKWVQFRRGQIYKEQVNINEMPDIDNDGFEKVVNRKKTHSSATQHIYYWHLYAHNLYSFDFGKKNKLNLFFCDPDYHIYQNDKIPQYAIDRRKTHQVISLIFFAKYNIMKFKPIAFIAKTEDQIKEALEHLSYCIVKKNHEEDIYEIVHEDQIELN